MAEGVTTLALACLLLLAGGWALVGGLALLPASADEARNLWPKLASLSITVISVVAAFVLGGWVLYLFLAAVVFRCLFEATWVAIHRPPLALGAGRVRALSLASSVVGTGLCLLAARLPFGISVPLGLVAGIAAALWLALGPRRSRGAKGEGLAAALEVAIFPALPLYLFFISANRADFAFMALAAYMLVEIFDSFALLGGKLFGKTRAFPRLSPGKTVEGLLSGAVMLAMLAVVFGWVLVHAAPVVSLSVALATGGLAVAGDLLASRLKRRSGVKDYPAISAEQGGLLDVFDSWVLVVAGLGVAMWLLPAS